jgi:hypothetical protein
VNVQIPTALIAAALVVAVALFIFAFHTFYIVIGVMFLVLVAYWAIDAFR